jgi:hypothetical protein
MENQLKLLNSLAKQIKAEKKDRKSIVETLKSAKILTKTENFTSNYSNLRKVVHVK